MIIFPVILYFGWLIVASILSERFFDLYLHRLDAWVSNGGALDAVQSQVVKNCSKLVLSQAGIVENIRMITIDRDEYYFRADVCTKMTINRVYKQPEFEKPDMVAMICGGSNPLFRRLCQRSGLVASGQ